MSGNDEALGPCHCGEPGVHVCLCCGKPLCVEHLAQVTAKLREMTGSPAPGEEQKD